MILAALVVAAAIVPDLKIDCPECNGVGSVEVVCPACQGEGLVKPAQSSMRKTNNQNYMKLPHHKVACRDCFRGAYKPTGKGTGKKRVTCKHCKGQKKIKVKQP